MRRFVLPGFVLTAMAYCLIVPSLLAAAPTKTLVCFGDSVTAGYGLDADKSYPAALQRLLAKRGDAWRVVNQGVSGNTTKDAAARVNSIVALHPDVVVVEFGGNDGLRGLPLDVTEKNLYRDAATKHHLALMAMLYDGIYTVPGTIQEDGIHPTAKGSQMIAEHMLPLLQPLLRK